MTDLTGLAQGAFAFSYNAAGDNTTGSFNIAEIKLSDAANPSWILTPVVTQSNISGDWVTAMSAQFGNGTYTAHMQQYKAVNWAVDKPVGHATVDVDFTVNLDTLALGQSTDVAQALALTPGGSSTLGNWIALSATASTLPNGTLIAFAVNDSGQMLNRDGSGTTTSIEEATLAKIGLVKADNGSLLFAGNQSVYLPVEANLKFAIVTGAGVTDTNPNVSVSGSGTLSVVVSDSAGQVNLTATVDNTLSESAVLAASQRMTDHAWVYLKQGTTVEVSQAWSGSYVNTLHFVRMDVDPSDATQLKVGGVAYGNTVAFQNALQNNWEFSSTQGNSTGTAVANWTVSGKDGFYAPVLVSPDGLWTINNSPTTTANADGAQHIRNFGENTFGFEDMSVGKGADFDYNDMIMKLTIL